VAASHPRLPNDIGQQTADKKCQTTGSAPGRLPPRSSPFDMTLKHPLSMNMKRFLIGITGCLLAAAPARATERLFTYTYEPETLPKGAFEVEQWVTLRAGRNAAAGREDYYRFQFREELEYGVTDRYQVALYFNHQYQHYVKPATGAEVSDYRSAGVSFENKYLLLNPADHAAGLALYVEPTWDWVHEMAKLEGKVIIGQRHGDWKWAINLTSETEWEHEYRDVVGEVEATLGLAWVMNSRWSFGLEMRNHAEIAEYEEWEGYALYLGPVVGYRRDRWWAALTVMPQIYGANFQGNPDGESGLDLAGHEKVNVRLLCGFNF
jgi:hypothetical protein